MNCNDIDKAVIGGFESPGVEEHIRSCARCRELAQALTIPSGSPSSVALGQIRRNLTRDLRPVRPIAQGGLILTAFVAIFVVVVAISMFRLRALALGAMSPIQTGVILVMLAICAGLLAYSVVKQMVPGALHWISPRLLPIGIVLALAITMIVLFQFHEERNFWLKSWACIRTGTPLAALAAVPMWFVLRRGAILTPALTGAATGLLAGLAGTAALEIHCPNLDASHILVAHLGVAIAGAIGGFILGTVTRIRA